MLRNVSNTIHSVFQNVTTTKQCTTYEIKKILVKDAFGNQKFMVTWFINLRILWEGMIFLFNLQTYRI